METPPVKDNLEVTGVSRSGRVRKKSSKLLDFQSPDEIEAKLKRFPAQKPPVPNPKSHPIQSAVSSPQSQQQPLPPLITSSSYSVQQMHSPPVNIKMDAPVDIPASEVDVEGMQLDDLDDLNSNGYSDDDEGNSLMIDTTVRKSAYMTEKSSKKKIFKDGKLVISKTQRKDKGKSRFTAYMLWAKDVRQDMLFSNPDLDFATISRRLGEMWANVPSSEKYNWRRRAKRLATTKGKEKDKITKPFAKHVPLNSKPLQTQANKFLNRTPPTPRPKKKKEVVPVSTKRTSAATTTASNVPPVVPETPPKKSEKSNASTSSHKKPPSTPIKTSPASSSGLFKVTGTTPADVAAHLKLLGDSLTIIGERLKEHEGQITVSGSLSVLLDSLLCSVGPLMCLTTCIPGFGHNVAHLKETMSNTLDNIAYVMPGVGPVARDLFSTNRSERL